MARKIYDSSLISRSSREKLKPRKKPYFKQIDRGRHLGYYKGSKGGTWVARRFIGDKDYEYCTLGTADDRRDADGIEVLSFGQAAEKALAWFKKQAHIDSGFSHVGPYTVEQALYDYRTSYIQRGGKAERDLTSRINALIIPYLGSLQLDKLTTKHIRDWQHELSMTPPRIRTGKRGQQQYKSSIEDDEYKRKRKSTANRTLTILKAALNYAFHDGKIDNDQAWRRVKPYREADVAKIRFLTVDEIKRLVNACTPEFRPLVQAALLTGCRYSEIIRLKCSDFNAASGTVTIRVSKSGKARHVYLNGQGIEFFIANTIGLIGDQLIFTKNNGTAWGKSHQQRPLTNACVIAKVTPIATFHILRHTYASHLVQSKVELKVIADNLGHADIRMTTKHYAHLAPSYIADVIRTSMPDMGVVSFNSKQVVKQLKLSESS